MTTAPTPHLRGLAEAAEGNGEHIYTHPRDSNKWRENEAWHRAASPGAVLHLLDRIYELEMQALDLASENSILKRAETDELEARKPLPLSDEQLRAEFIPWAEIQYRHEDEFTVRDFTICLAAWSAGRRASLVDKSPNLQEPLVDKTENLQDRTGSLQGITGGSS